MIGVACLAFVVGRLQMAYRARSGSAFNAFPTKTIVAEEHVQSRFVYVRRVWQPKTIESVLGDVLLDKQVQGR